MLENTCHTLLLLLLLLLLSYCPKSVNQLHLMPRAHPTPKARHTLVPGLRKLQTQTLLSNA